MLCDCGRKLTNETIHSVRIKCTCGAVHELPPGKPADELFLRPNEPTHDAGNAQRSHWRKLHRFPFSGNWNCQSRCEWWKDWQESIPNVNCECRRHWLELVAKHPPTFKSRLDFFLWTVDRHNDVNARLGKPILTQHEARCLHDMHYALTQPETLPVGRSSFAVVSIASGSHVATLDQTRPLRAAYAERVGADLIELTDDRWPDYPMFNKWRLSNIFKHGYERLLYVDSDVIIKPDAPNVFDAVPTDAIGLVNEFPTIRANGEVQAGYEKEFAHIAGEAGWTMPQWCPNGGVIVLPRALAHVYEPPEIMPQNRWCLDQYLLAVDCEKHGAKVELLDSRWNWGWIDKRFWSGLDDAYFVHVNGSGSGDYRHKLLGRIIAGNHRPLRPPSGMWAAFLVDSRGDTFYGEP